MTLHSTEGVALARPRSFPHHSRVVLMDRCSISILLFAGLAESVGHREVSLAWPGGTAAELRTQLQQHFPAAAPLLARSAIAVGERYCRDDETVPPDADVAVIPPVSGG